MLYTILISLLVVTGLVVVWVILRRRSAGKPLIAIAMLRETPRAVSEADVRQAVRLALGIEAQIMPVPIDGDAKAFGVLGDGPPLGIIVASRPYMEDPAEASQGAEDPRAREALLRHRAWIAVDLMGPCSKADRPIAYAVLGKVAAELLDAGCTLLYLPETSRLALPGPDAERLLRAGKIGELFSDDDLNQPIIRTDNDDAAINAAIKEAQRRWPEFVRAFQRLGTNATPMIKVRFPLLGDSNEYIWVRATAITSQTVTGIIENRPADPSIPKKGESVTVSHDRVVDWAYSEDGKPVGLFVERVLRR